MLTIHQYHCPLADNVTIPMPESAQVLSFKIRRWQAPAVYSIWALVETEKPKVLRHFQIVGTGTPADGLDKNSYVGTVQDGPYVWHLFEVEKL